MNGSVWTLNGTTAQFDDGRLRARIELLEPLGGLRALNYAGKAIGPDDDGALGVDLGKVAADDLSLPETYARVDDLVATYLQTEARPYRAQAYWRRVEDSKTAVSRNGTVIELQVSINTSLLDTHPAIRVASRIRGLCEREASADRYATVRTASGCIYFEAVHPGDRRRSTGAVVADGSGMTHVLFGDFLEKGVIVRARIRAAFLPADTGAADIDALYDDFVNEPLPLMT